MSSVDRVVGIIPTQNTDTVPRGNARRDIVTDLLLSLNGRAGQPSRPPRGRFSIDLGRGRSR